MKVSRAIVVAISGVAYPWLVGIVAAGLLTFTVTNVFAEAGTLPPCADPTFDECASSADLAACTTCIGGKCACLNAACTTGDAGFVPTLACRPITDLGLSTCDQPAISSCAGKQVNEPCGAKSTCVPGSCAMLDGGAWSRDDGVLICVGSAAPTDAGSDAATAVDAAEGGTSAGVDASASAGVDASARTETSDASASDARDARPLDSGCSLANQDSRASLLASTALTIGVALLWRLRRRRK